MTNNDFVGVDQVILIPSTSVPLPPIKGGAVQNLIDFFIQFNEKNLCKEMIVMSIYHPSLKNINSKYKYTHFEYSLSPNWLLKIRNYASKPFSSISYKLVEYLFLLKVRKILRRQVGRTMIIFENTPFYYLKLKKYIHKDDQVIHHLYNDLLNENTPNVKSIVNAADKIITVSKYNADIIKDISSKDNVYILNNCIDILKFLSINRNHVRDEMRKLYEISEKEVVFIFVARLVPEKGIRELLISFVELLKMRNAKLIVIGNKLYGEKLVDPFLLQLKEIAKKNDGDILFTGYIDYQDLYKYYAMADVGVLPSLYEEPFSLAAIEYMASSLVPIVTNVGGFKEMIDNVGIIVENDDNLLDSLTIAMIEMIDNDKLRKSKSKLAKERSREFSKERYCQNLEDILFNK